jgi:hypothetical protein
MFNHVEVTMKQGLDDCTPRRKVFSPPVTGGHRIPLFRENLMPGGLTLPVDIVLFSLNESASLW